eukprot:TRINITY_DN61_c1_g1_i1.p1 TRINITY_DN61_c1_g1~~TRINITY_DN61_c1_g1_i1.p1  ORF type:complete len:366 (+),score=44.91 TRINITY_DN61_c1_g1_i1:43-1140(+)
MTQQHLMYSVFVLGILATAKSATPDLGPVLQDAAGGQNLTVHVLWPNSRPRPGESEYAPFFKKTLEWVSAEKLPCVEPDAKVDLFYLTKPIFSVVGKTTGIWHGALGLRVENGSSYVFEYTSLDFEAALVYPDRNTTASVGELLHWPSAAIVDYLIDPSGTTFPETGAAWKETHSIGTTTGAVFNMFSRWAFDYASNHSRYLVWRVLENNTERTLLDSRQCFDFVFHGIRFLRSQEDTEITVESLPRTVANVYASIESLDFNESVGNFFANKKRVLAEWFELSRKMPIRTGPHSKEWYWPAWYSLTEYAGGTDQLLQDTDFPHTYHRYALAWPKQFKTTFTQIGLHRADMPIFSEFHLEGSTIQV